MGQHTTAAAWIYSEVCLLPSPDALGWLVTSFYLLWAAKRTPILVLLSEHAIAIMAAFNWDKDSFQVYLHYSKIPSSVTGKWKD